MRIYTRSADDVGYMEINLEQSGDTRNNAKTATTKATIASTTKPTAMSDIDCSILQVNVVDGRGVESMGD